MHSEGLPDRPARQPPQTHAAAGRLPEFIARLREAGWEPTAEEVAEALWLARWTGTDVREDAPPSPAGEEEAAADPASLPSPSVPPASPADRGADPPAPVWAERSAPVSLYAPDRHGGTPPRAFAVRAPAASTLPGLLGFQRAMRPLLGYRPQLPAAPGPLDEAATADLSARSAAIRPVFGPAARPDADVLLLMDASATTSVWQLTFDILRQTCEQLGAFRDVQALYLHRAADGSPLIGTSPERAATRLRPADQYRDTTGRQLTLVVSDCVGPLWQDGGAHRLLHRWSGSSPLAVVQPLPPRLWHRTALPAQSGLLIRDRDASGRLAFEPDDSGQPPSHDALAVPVLLPTTAALGSWARLLGGRGGRTVRGAAAWVRPRHHAMPAPGPSQNRPRADELLADFRASASPGALDLVVHLAAVPLVLPVIQLVQEAMLPDSGPMELAEVLLSGLLERLPDIEGSPGPRYDFAPGVQELLLQSLDRGAAMLVLKYLGEYVGRRFGKGTRNFPALAVARLSGQSPETSESDWPEPWEGISDELFAEVPARVVRWYDPESAAPGVVDEAERLLQRWRTQGDPWLLEEARTHAEAALLAATGAGTASRPGNAVPPGTTGPAEDRDLDTDTDAGGDSVELPRARLVLGQVLHALTETAEIRRNPGRALGLLRDSAHLLTGNDLDTRFELVAVRQDLWRAERDPAHLRAAVLTLRTMAEEARAGGRTLPDRTEARRLLLLGRILLALGDVDGRTPAEKRSFATEAADQLRASGELLASAGADDRQLCAALLDLSAALRKAGADAVERLANLDRAEAAAGDSPTLRLRCARARARVHRDAGDTAAAASAYQAAEIHALPDSLERAELLTEWGTMLLDSADGGAHAEGLLREALTTVPAAGPLAARLQLLLGRALVARYERESFLPDLYEGCHLLEQAARKGQDGELRAEAWLLLGIARQDFPEGHVAPERAEQALTRSLNEARQTQGTAPGSVAAARALLRRGVFHQHRGRPDQALTDLRAAAAEWQALTGHLADDVPWHEVRETRERIAALEAE
jgi:tetratricopeptide (TPR) repeat protein